MVIFPGLLLFNLNKSIFTILRGERIKKKFVQKVSNLEAK